MPSTQELLYKWTLKDAFSAAAERAMAQLRQLDAQFSQLESSSAGAWQGMGKQIKASQIANAKGIKDLAGELPALAQGAALMASPWALAGAAVAGVGAGLASATRSAMAFEQGMAKVNVTARKSPAELKQMSDQVAEIARRSTVEFQSVPVALNRIISAGLDGDSAMAALEPTLRAAKAGFADVETVAGAAVSVMNASGVQDVNKVYDVLFATLREGNAEFTEIAAYLPRILPAATAAGSSLEQVGGAFAYLTAQGQSADRASNLLENAFKALTDPARIEDFGRIGVKIFDSAGKMRPLLGIVQDLDKSMQGLTDEQRVEKFASLGLDMEASSAFAALAADTAKLERALGSTAAAQGELDAAFSNSLSTQDKFLQVQNQVQFLMLKIGEAVLPLVSQALDWLISGFESAHNTFKVFKPALEVLGSVFQAVGGYVSDLYGFVWKLIKTAVQAVNVLNAIKSGGNLAAEWETLKEIWEAPKAPRPADASVQASAAPAAPLVPGSPPASPLAPVRPAADKDLGIGGVSGPASQQVRNVTMNVKIGDNHFHVASNGSSASQSIDDFSRMLRESLIRELRNIEYIA